jgi:hypothetical protein
MNNYQPYLFQLQNIQPIQAAANTVSRKSITITDNRPATLIQLKKVQGMTKPDRIQRPVQKKENDTGLNGYSNTGIENLSRKRADNEGLLNRNFAITQRQQENLPVQRIVFQDDNKTWRTSYDHNRTFTSFRDANNYEKGIIEEFSQYWHPGEFTSERGLKYHWEQHGEATFSSVEEYTKAAEAFNDNHRGRNYRQEWQIDNGEGYKITADGYFGIYADDGRIVTFGIDDSQDQVPDDNREEEVANNNAAAYNDDVEMEDAPGAVSAGNADVSDNEPELPDANNTDFYYHDQDRLAHDGI